MEREHGPVIAYCVIGDRKEQLANEGQLKKLAREQEAAARIAPLRREGATAFELKALDEWFKRTTAPARNKAPNKLTPSSYPGQVLDHVCGFKGIIKRTPHKTCPACAEERRFKDVEVVSVERVKRSTKRVHVLQYIDDVDAIRYSNDPELILKLTKVALPIGTKLRVRWIKQPRRKAFKLEVKVARDSHLFVPIKGTKTSSSFTGRALLDLKIVDVMVTTNDGAIINPNAQTQDELYVRPLDSDEVVAAKEALFS